MAHIFYHIVDNICTESAVANCTDYYLVTLSGGPNDYWMRDDCHDFCGCRTKPYPLCHAPDGPGIGLHYDPEKKVFYMPEPPHPGWELDPEHLVYLPPSGKEYPGDKNNCDRPSHTWSEAAENWVPYPDGYWDNTTCLPSEEELEML
jgi:hypothetical protein